MLPEMSIYMSEVSVSREALGLCLGEAGGLLNQQDAFAVMKYSDIEIFAVGWSETIRNIVKSLCTHLRLSNVC